MDTALEADPMDPFTKWRRWKWRLETVYDEVNVVRAFLFLYRRCDRPVLALRETS